MYKIITVLAAFFMLNTGLSAQVSPERNRRLVQQEVSENLINHLQEWSLRLSEALTMEDMPSVEAITGRILRDLNAQNAENKELAALKDSLKNFWMEERNYSAGLKLLEEFIDLKEK